MTRHHFRDRLFAISLALLAGYIDALGFLNLGGYFVSFMTGNSTRLGVNLIEAPAQAAIPAGLIVLFISGVVLGTLVAHASGAWRKPMVMAFVAALLLIAVLLHTASTAAGPIIAMTLAMGAENAVYERDGEVSIGLTYMTGNLVKLGQRLTSALFLKGDREAWVWYLLHWSGLVSGAAIGTWTYLRLGLSGLWFAVAGAAALSGLSFLFQDGGPRRRYL